MTHAISLPSRNAGSVAPVRSIKGLSAMLGAMLLAASLLFSGRASADPAVANQIMQVMRVDRQLFDFHLQTARQHVANGNVAGARASFTNAQIQAIKLNMDLVRLRQANQDSLDRGLYRDRVALERAIQYGQSASVQSQILTIDLQSLSQNPFSPELRARLDLDLVLFNMYMTQLEQAMRDA